MWDEWMRMWYVLGADLPGSTNANEDEPNEKNWVASIASQLPQSPKA